ncbi:MAG: cohesin domain-containing protein [Candidatus Eisenbacteria bacterium]
MKMRLFLTLGVCSALALFASSAAAVTHTIKLGAAYAAASAMAPTLTEQHLGSGSWSKLTTSPKAETYLDVASTFGTSFTVDQIAAVQYHTKSDVSNPSGTDFFMVLYTQPYVGGFASWYGQRLIAEPYLSNGYVPQTPGAWSAWRTAAGANQLTFNDNNHSGNQGFYNAPTLADVQAGAIDWSALGSNPTAGSASGGAIDYGAQAVKFVSFQTGSGWASFRGWLDDVTVTLTNGDVYVLDFESVTDPLYVDDNWAGSGLGAEVAPGRWFGWNAFAAPGDAAPVAQPSGTVHVEAGTYVIGTTIASTAANLTWHGAGAGSTTFQVASAVGNAMAITGPGTTLRDVTIQKTDLPGAPHELVWVNATNVTIRDDVFFGPDPGTPWSVNGIVSRGLVVSPGANGLTVQGCSFTHLRQPAYIDALTGGTIANNHVSGTRGWVVAGAALAFTGNTWGPPENQGAEIALLSTCTPAQYPDLLALSAANHNAHISGQFAGASSGRAIGYVNASAAPGGFGSASAPYQAVQAGVDNTLPGGTVQVAAGSYTEQVVVNGKNLTIQGAGRANTFIVSPVTLAASFTTPTNNAPVVFLENSGDIRVRDLTVDGAGRGNANYRFIGVGFWNAGGKVLDCDVVHVHDTPISGAQHGNGIYAYNNTGGPYAIEVGGCNVSDFQKNGITMNGAGLTANVHDCVVTGHGNIAYTAENGIQFGFGAGGSVANTSVSGVFYTPNTTVGCALLAFGGPSLAVTGFTATACQVGAYFENTNGSLNGVTIGGNTSSVPATGVLVYDSNASLAARALSGGFTPKPYSAVMAGGADDKSGAAPNAASSAPMVVSVGPGCLTGDGLTNSMGVQVYGGGGPLSCTLAGLEVTGWDYGVAAGGVNVTTTAHGNAFAGNLTAGWYSDAGLVNDATSNWWGQASGPGGTGPGTGDAIDGATVAFSPWLVAGDTNPGCGFTAGPPNVITAGPAPSCISVANPCVSIPVDVARTTSEGARGFSVTLQLSANLQLCAGPGSITQGTYLNSVGMTNFQVVDNGGGSYTVDCAILGPTAGATAVSGRLFDLAVKKVAGPDGTGTITIGAVLMRDVANAPIAATAGAPLSITIDTGGPAAIANLAAAQKLTGNDADGTTKILLTFTAPPDAAVVQVYRAPFGQYPEYDDAGGAAPAAPTYPPTAPWTLTGVTASGQYDEPASRDFWYYVAFSTDACGNVSAVSNRTNGTLDYHLGDVSNGMLAGAGDNQVSTADISLLGAHYGTNLAPADPFNYLDVGPTTDYSTHARPTTDNRVNFEDLMMFAINYSAVSAPQDRLVPVAASTNAIEIATVTGGTAGETFVVPVRMSGAGDVLGASIALDYDRAMVEFVSVAPGELLQSQGRTAAVLSPAAGVVDFALLGEGSGVSGEGVIANVTFRRIASGDAGVRVRSVTARDGANQPVSFAGSKPLVPSHTLLGSAYPNPFRGSTSLRLSLAFEGHVRVAVYDLVGRRIRTLTDGTMSAGERTLVWDGRDDDGRAVAAGLYLVKMDTAGAKQSHRLVLMP